MRITPKLFAGLAVAAGVSLVAAGVVYTTSHQWSVGDVAGSALFPKLEERANDVATLELRKGEATLVLGRKDDGWVARDMGGYPVRPEKVREVIVRMAQAELIEPKTRNPERYALLDLGDPAAKDSEARRIRLLDGDGRVIVEAILGRKRWNAFGSGKNGTYVRLPDDRQTWLSNLDIEAKPEIKDWVEARIFSVETAKISALTVTHEGEAPLKITRVPGEKGKFQLADLPEGSKLKEPAPTTDGVAKGYSSIELEDLRKLDMTPASAAVAHLETEDGLKVTFRLRNEKDERWLSLSAEGEGEAAARAEEINARVKGWEYRIPDWTADNLFRSRSEFIETS
jgi:hypothetical protein